MASDWVKVRTDLYVDPKVSIMADMLSSPNGELAAFVSQHMQRDMCVTRNVTRNVTVGALVRVWGVTRHRGKRQGDDMIIKFGTLETLDDIADLPGFGVAMESVGWVVETEDGLVFPNFYEEYNTDPAEEARKKNAERQRRYRAKGGQDSNVTRNVTVTSRSNTEKSREEKSREENKHTHTQADPVWSAEWDRWVASWEGRTGRRYDEQQADIQLMQLHRLPADKARRDLEFSLEKYSKTILDSDHDFQRTKVGVGGPRKKEWKV